MNLPMLEQQINAAMTKFEIFDLQDAGGGALAARIRRKGSAAAPSKYVSFAPPPVLDPDDLAQQLDRAIPSGWPL